MANAEASFIQPAGDKDLGILIREETTDDYKSHRCYLVWNPRDIPLGAIRGPGLGMVTLRVGERRRSRPLNGTISIALADVNGDGKLDAVIAEDPPLVIGSGGIFVQLGDGQGGFGSPKLIATIGLGQVRTVTAADFNRDGKMDIAYLSVTDQNRVTVLHGNGTFQAPKVVTSAGLGTLFSTYSIGDFNNDGITTKPAPERLPQDHPGAGSSAR